MFSDKITKIFERQNQLMTITIGHVITEGGVVMKGSATTNESTGATDTCTMDKLSWLVLLSK